MLNHQNYIQMIDSSIDKNFRLLDRAIEGCEKLKEVRKTYYQALNEYHSDNDNVRKFLSKYMTTLKKTEANMEMLQEDIGSYVCDSYHTIEPLTVGLFGEWGSGKTHLLKGVKNHIILRQERVKILWENTPNPDEPRVDKLVIPIFFNAWRFEKEEHIIIPLFQTLLSELENYDHIPQLKQIKTKIKILSFALVKNLQMPKGLDIAKVFAGDFDSLKGVGGFFNWKGLSDTIDKEQKKRDKNYLLEQLLTSERIESVYFKIPQWIEKITIFDDVRFVFLVDDLDRCLPENTLKMLESMKLFLDVAGCSFVLAVDDDVVERGVEHHYRDYLQRNSNHIYMNMPCDESQEEQSQQTHTKGKEERLVLPITGSEYLEKMVQLPFRIPPIDTQDVRAFLEQRYERFKKQEQKEEALDDEKREIEKLNQDIENLLSFFSNNIPSKPRKIIRTINLFESKEELMKSLNLEFYPILLAKLTLLELFVPKLFRFMQTKGFIGVFELLVRWQKQQSLGERKVIREIITDNKEDISQIEQDNRTRLLGIIEEHYQSRIDFDLDIIFNEEMSDKLLILHILFKEKKSTKSINILNLLSPSNKKLFFERLLSNDDILWRDAFREDKNLFSNNVGLNSDSFKSLLDGLEQKKELVQNPIWLKNISVHLIDEDFKELLTRYNPFKGLADE